MAYDTGPVFTDAITEVRTYVFTFVTEFGEEGPPSAPTIATGAADSTWQLTIQGPEPSQTYRRSLKTIRIYRTVTSSVGAASYYFVDEIPITQTTYADTKLDTDITGNNQLASTSWTAPPADLQGLVALPNGILAGWRSNELWFCEPYRPHAWPVAYQISVESAIVGLGVVGQTLIVCTTTFPYAATGINPSNMSLSKIGVYEPCLSRASIVSSTDGVFYISPNGLMLAVPGRVQNITRAFITKDIWLTQYAPSTLRAVRFGLSYFAVGTTAGVLIDPVDQRIALSTLAFSPAVKNIQIDNWSGEALLIRDNKLYWLDLGDTNIREPYLWRSRILQTSKKQNMEAVKVFFSIPAGAPTLASQPNTNLNQTLAANQYALLRVYADGRLVVTRELRVSGEQIRLPSGFKADFWQIEVEGRVPILNIQAATAARELTVV
jgi:hypothetical protein